MLGTGQHRLAGHGLDDIGVNFLGLVLAQPLQGPKALHAGLVGVVGTVGFFKSRNDGEQGRIFGFEGGCECCRGTVAHAGDQLPLVDQVGVAAQWRCAPGVARHANASMR